eukprot:SAG31_NODE_32814_length_351_cov_0.829365_1_plen_37_part_10
MSLLAKYDPQICFGHLRPGPPNDDGARPKSIFQLWIF